MDTNRKLQGCSFSILGDSYSTYDGYIPEEYCHYYPNPDKVDDVLGVEDTWWKKLEQQYGMRLLVNDSYSGSTVCNQVRESLPASSAFTIRTKECNFSSPDGEDPNYIIVFGGTNDDWLGRTIGAVQLQNWTDADLRCVLPAYCYALQNLKKRYPQSKIVTVANNEIDATLAEGIRCASEYFGCIHIPLKNIDKQNGHPTLRGMNKIATQIGEALCNAGTRTMHD